MLGYIPPIPADATIRVRLGMILWGVMAYLGDRERRAPDGYGPPHRLIPLPLVMRMQDWLKDRRLRIEALLDRIRDGKLRKPRPYAPLAVKDGLTPAPRKPTPPEERLPRGFAWMHNMANEIRHRAGLLPEWLEEPEVKAAVLASPQMVRLVSPLLNAVAIAKPDWFPELPKRPRKSRAGEAKRSPSPYGESDLIGLHTGSPSSLVPGSGPGLTRRAAPPREAGGVAGDRRVKPGNDDPLGEVAAPPVEPYEIPEWQRLIFPRLRSNWRR
jgi:hypothetical protein